MGYILQNIIDALSLGSIYALTALAVGVIFGVMRLVNFAHGSYITICAFILLVPAGEGVAYPLLGTLPGFLLVPVILAVGVALAIVSELVLFRHLRNTDPATMMVASFALASGVQNALRMAYGSRPLPVSLWPNLTAPVNLFGLTVPALQIVIVLTTMLALMVLVAFLRFTRFGAAMRASAENFDMARMLGIPASAVFLAAFAISGFLAAVTALLLLPQTGLADLAMADNILLIAFVATVVGGMGNLTGAVLSGFAIGFISVLFQTLLPIDLRPFRDAFVYFAVILTLMFRPEGLFSTGKSGERV